MRGEALPTAPAIARIEREASPGHARLALTLVAILLAVGLVADAGRVAAFPAAIEPAAPVSDAAPPWEAGLLALADDYGLTCERSPADGGGTFVACPPVTGGTVSELTVTYRLDAAGSGTGFELGTNTPGLGPPEGRPLDFLLDGAALVCDAGDSADLATFISDHGTATEEGAMASFTGDTCEASILAIVGGANGNLNQIFLSIWPRVAVDESPAAPTPVGEETPAASASATPGAGEAPAGPPADDPRAGAQGEPFHRSIPTAGELSTDPIVLLQSALLALLVVFLMPFPGQLFNSTLETHEDEVRGWLRLDRLGAMSRGVGAFWSSWPGVIAFVLIATLLYAFLDPGFGANLGSLATFLGMLAGLVLVTVLAAIPMLLFLRGGGPSPKVVPISLVVGVACVLVTRLTGFQPGYMYGLLIGFAFAVELSAREEGRTTAIGAALMLVVALVAWAALGALPAPDDPGFGLAALRTALAALMVAGLEGVVFGLMPLRFLPGAPVLAWNRLVWGALLAIGAFAFFHILINPASGYLSDTSRTPLFTVLGLLIGFSVVSVAFWAWFRFREPPPAEERTTA